MKKIILILIILLPFNLLAQETSYYGFQQFKIGKIEATIFSDGHVPIQPIQPTLAPDIDPQLLSNILQDNFLATGNINFSMNVLLLKKDNQLILIDAGAGNMLETGGRLLESQKQWEFRITKLPI